MHGHADVAAQIFFYISYRECSRGRQVLIFISLSHFPQFNVLSHISHLTYIIEAIDIGQLDHNPLRLQPSVYQCDKLELCKVLVHVACVIQRSYIINVMYPVRGVRV
jgi:hypothetical protein